MIPILEEAALPGARGGTDDVGQHHRDAVVLGLRHVVGVPDHLQPDQAREQKAKDDEEKEKKRKAAADTATKIHASRALIAPRRPRVRAASRCRRSA